MGRRVDRLAVADGSALAPFRLRPAHTRVWSGSLPDEGIVGDDVLAAEHVEQVKATVLHQRQQRFIARDREGVETA